MSPAITGAGAACAASCLYNAGVALQAVEARRVPLGSVIDIGLVTRLAHTPRWLLGGALGILGWPLQTLALSVAPLTVVQPALALGLLLLLGLGARALGEPVGVREWGAVVAIIAGVAALALVAPDRSSGHGPTVPFVIGMTLLGAAAIAPLLLARSRAITGQVGALSAGAGFAWSGVSTKFVADAAQNGAWAPAAAWTAATAAASAIALVSESAALQRMAATRVAPLVFVVQVLVPVLLGPLIAGEAWPHSGPLFVAGLGAVVGGALALGSSPAVRALVEEPSAVPTGAGRNPR